MLRKIAGFTGGRNEHSWSKQFFGLSEADAVFCIARILEAVGYDVYLECKAKHRDGRVDIYAESWQDGDAIWCEVKTLWDKGDNRLNAARYQNTKEILKDCDLLDSENLHGRKMLVVVAFSSSEVLESMLPSQKTLRLDDVIQDISGVVRMPPIWHRVSLAPYVETEKNCSVLHCFVWIREAG